MPDALRDPIDRDVLGFDGPPRARQSPSGFSNLTCLVEVVGPGEMGWSEGYGER